MPFGDHKPVVGKGVFVAPNAAVIGNVTVGEKSSIWYGAVIRGVLNPLSLRIGTSR